MLLPPPCMESGQSSSQEYPRQDIINEEECTDSRTGWDDLEQYRAECSQPDAERRYPGRDCCEYCYYLRVCHHPGMAIPSAPVSDLATTRYRMINRAGKATYKSVITATGQQAFFTWSIPGSRYATTPQPAACRMCRQVAVASMIHPIEALFYCVPSIGESDTPAGGYPGSP